MNTAEIKAFIHAHRPLFWSVPESALDEISLNLVVATVLQYGDIEDIQRLFQIMGIQKVAAIFSEQITKRRCNYQPRTINYFKLYFQHHAS